MAFCYRSRWISSFPPPRPVPAGSYTTRRLGMNSTHTCNRLNTLSIPLYDYPAKITNWACLQFSQDHFGDPINLDSDSSVDYPQSIKKRRVKPETDLFGLWLPCHCLRAQGVKPEVLRRATRLQASKLRKNISENKVGIALLFLQPVDNRLPGLLPRLQFIKCRTELFHCR